MLAVWAEISCLVTVESEEVGWANPAVTYAAIFVLITNIGITLFPWWFGITINPDGEREQKRKDKRR